MSWRVKRGRALDPGVVWPYHDGMATTTVKTTYSLDPATVARLDALARGWGVSRSEALRRVVRAAAGEGVEGGADALSALDQLQASLALSDGAAREWAAAARRERHAGSARRERPEP